MFPPTGDDPVQGYVPKPAGIRSMSLECSQNTLSFWERGGACWTVALMAQYCLARVSPAIRSLPSPNWPNLGAYINQQQLKGNWPPKVWTVWAEKCRRQQV